VLTGLRRLIDQSATSPSLPSRRTAELVRELDDFQPNALILDYELARGDGLAQCAHQAPPVRPARDHLSAYAGPAPTLAARAPQADGLIDEPAPVPTLLSAMRRVANGEVVMAPIARDVFESAVARLDDDDLPVFAMLVDREPLASMAEALRTDRADVGRRAQRIVGRLRPRLACDSSALALDGGRSRRGEHHSEVRG
jgi:DNA-binding NarL/FixJ family response regulator